MNRKALGRGLGALLSSDQMVDQSAESSEIPVDLIDPGPMQPRTNFDEEAIASLVESIRNHGIVQPILVRRKARRYELIAGERRWRAARLAGLQAIPALVRDVADENLLEIALIENIQRENLNPIEEAEAYRKLLDTVGLTQEALAERVGRDRSYITNYLRLLRLPEDLQKLVTTKKLSAGHARTILGAPHVDQQRRLARHVIESDLSVRATENLVKRMVEGGAGKPPSRLRIADANTRAAETKLRRTLGTQVKILQSETGKGKIEISFFDAKELDRLYSLLMSSTVHGNAG